MALSLASQSAPIVSHIQRVQFDYMFIQSSPAGFDGFDELPSNPLTGTLSQWVDQPLAGQTSLLIFSLLLLFNWTLGAQSGAPMWVSVSISLHHRKKVPSWY